LALTVKVKRLELSTRSHSGKERFHDVPLKIFILFGGMVQPVFQHKSCYTARGKPTSHIVAFSIHGQKDVTAAWSNDDGGPGGYRAIRQERSQRGIDDVSYSLPGV
jgi:hypothetical protein